ncbi:MAG: hypothetical protein M1814_000020 [Vezdaea aestivalis]|nr:MAG: hypothetical protein M1814_000020 [Vezdaea aestivalis]
MTSTPFSEPSYATLTSKFPCRAKQIRQLSLLVDPSLPNPPTIVVHGLTATGKSSVTAAVLSALNLPYAIIKSQECITTRHLLERTIGAVEDALAVANIPIPQGLQSTRCESISSLCVQLQDVLKQCPRFVLVLDGIDHQREAPSTLLPSLARFHESISNLTLLFILTHSSPTLFHRPGIPHIHFPPYTRPQSIHILSHDPPRIFPDGADLEDLPVWNHFLGTIWDVFGKTGARDLVSLRRAALTLWPAFVKPIVEGQFGTRDYTKLLVAQRRLLQGEAGLGDENMVTAEDVQPEEQNGEDEKEDNDKSEATTDQATTPIAAPKRTAYDLPFYSKYLLIAAYLASHNPPSSDMRFFSSDTTSRRRRRGALVDTSHGSQTMNSRTRAKLLRPHLPPSTFPLERMFAIFHAIVPDRVERTIDIATQVATLASLRLVVRATAGAGKDVLDRAGKWRVNVGWEFIRGLARTVGFEVEERVAD